MKSSDAPRLVLAKSFFGKGNCFKYLHYDNNAIFFHFGSEGKDKQWSWKKVKMNDAELGQVLLVLEGRKSEANFFHSFGEGSDKQTTQIWVSRKPDERTGGEVVFVKVKELSKSLTEGEQRVFQALISHSLIRASMSL